MMGFLHYGAGGGTTTLSVHQGQILVHSEDGTPILVPDDNGVDVDASDNGVTVQSNDSQVTIDGI